MGGTVQYRPRVAGRRAERRCPEPQRRPQRHHRQLQRTGSPRQLRNGDRCDGSGGCRRKDHSRLGGRQRSRRRVRRNHGPLRERHDQCGLGRGAAGLGRTDSRAAGTFYRRRSLEFERPNRLLLQSLRHRRRFLHRGARSRCPRCLFRTPPRHRGPISRPHHRRRNIGGRTLRRRRAGADEAALSRSALQHRAGHPALRNRERPGHLCQPGCLRPRRHGSPRRDISRGGAGRAGRKQPRGRRGRRPARDQAAGRRGVRRRARTFPGRHGDSRRSTISAPRSGSIWAVSRPARRPGR